MEESMARSAGRPRDPAADRAIIDATLEIMAEQGFEGLRVADVAERARVSKATMYRRWPSKTELVVAALQTTPPLPEVDTGTLRGDLVELLTDFLAVAAATPVIGLLAGLAAERQSSPRLVRALDPFVGERMRPLVHALQRAIGRGEISPEIDVALAAEMLGGPLVLRLFFGGATDAATVGRLVDHVVGGLES
jgi:AcrR family transcriptional regulator